MTLSKDQITNIIETIMQKLDKNLGELFLNAIYDNDIVRAQEIFVQDPGVLNFQGDLAQEGYSFSALHIAAFRNNVEIITWLLSCDNILPNICASGGGMTPLHCAVISNSLDAMRVMILDDQVNVNAAEGNFTPLHFAVQNNSREEVEILLSAPAVDINSNRDISMRPLHIAAISSYENSLNALLDNPRLEIDAVIENNRTALYCAIEAGHASTVHMLLSHGANPNIPNIQGQYPIHLASANGNIDMVHDLLASDNIDSNILLSGSTPLILAIQNNHLDLAIEMLKSKKVDPTIADCDGITALHLAAANGYNDLMNALFGSGGIDVNAKATNGATPLHWAVFKQQIASVNMLLNCHNIDTDVMLNGKTPADLSVGTPTEALFISHYARKLKISDEATSTTTLKSSAAKEDAKEDEGEDDREELYTMDKAWADFQREDYSAMKNILGHNKTSLSGKKSGERASIGATIQEKIEAGIDPSLVLYAVLFTAHMQQKNHAIAEELMEKVIVATLNMDISHCDEYRGDIKDIVSIPGIAEFLEVGIKYAMYMRYGDEGEMSLVDYVVHKGHAEILPLFKICGIEVPEVAESVIEIAQVFSDLVINEDPYHHNDLDVIGEVPE